MAKTKELKILQYDPYLRGYRSDIELRMENYRRKKKELLKNDANLCDFANGHHYFGMHTEDGETVLREWAPAADRIAVIGDFNGWNKEKHLMNRLENGVFEIRFTGKKQPKPGDKYKLWVTHGTESFERIPSYATYVVQDARTTLWSAVVPTEEPFEWTNVRFRSEAPVIYEAHIGMATEEYGIGSYENFRVNILPRIKKAGYNTIQLMAIAEHPYYASFGYQVSSFFAASSRYGTPLELKQLIDEAHKNHIRVLLDVVHSHAVRNEAEGLGRFDGTEYQYFHEGPEGDHPAWGTKCFDYGKNEVIHFLLSNLKFWLEEYHFDGFRFDGVTSMLYHDHGLGENFDNYGKYFSMNTDTEAITYLQLANELIHDMKPKAISICEDMSGMPGMCLPIQDGGVGFDYRLQMGTPDLWTKYLTEIRDEDWCMSQLYYELTGHRSHEKVINYAESHDQALVGDKTIMFRLCDQEMYWHMDKNTRDSMTINRGMALHKMIRLLTFGLARDGYLNFMGNEFGHPEWIDFPREGNNWSYHYARRQWSLADDKNLHYNELLKFDREMVKRGREEKMFENAPMKMWLHEADKTLVFQRGNLLFAFNFHPNRSFTGYFLPVLEKGTYRALFSTDDRAFGGYGRVSEEMNYETRDLSDGRQGIMTYLPARTATVYIVE